jgi:hypothetical protein
VEEEDSCHLKAELHTPLHNIGVIWGDLLD